MRESQIGHGLLTLSQSLDRGHRSQANAQVYVLCIHTGSLPEGAKEELRFSYDEQLAWMTAAAERGCSLVVMCTDDSIELYTTDRDRFAALKPVLRAMAERVRKRPDLGSTATVQLGHDAVARRLFVRAAGMKAAGCRTTTTASTIHRAAAISAASTALGPMLAPLFRAAGNVARRVRQETAMESQGVSESLRELEAFAAERIVEEELAIWQAQEAEIQRETSELPGRQGLSNSSFSSPEPASEVRLRIGTTIKPRISYVLEPKCASTS